MQGNNGKERFLVAALLEMTERALFLEMTEREMFLEMTERALFLEMAKFKALDSGMRDLRAQGIEC